MKTNTKKILFGMAVSLVLVTIIVGAFPRLPSIVYCGEDCKVINSEGNFCEDCFVQIIRTQDNKINPPTSNGSVSGDEVVLGEEETCSKDFCVGEFSDTLDLAGGDKIYARVWDSKEVSNAEYFGESEILDIKNPGGNYFFKEFSLNKEKSNLVSSSVSGGTDGGGTGGSTREGAKEVSTEEIKNTREKKEENDSGEGYVFNYSNEGGDIEGEQGKKYKGLSLLFIIVLAIGISVFIISKKRKTGFSKFLSKKRGKNGEKI